jgi:transposase
MWTRANRRRYERKGCRYPSDLTDDEWAIVDPLLPVSGRTDRRRPMLDAILYVLETGCQWRALPKDFPPKSSVHEYFLRLHCDGILTRIHHELYARARELAGKAAEPTTSIVDSQSVKSAEKGGLRSIRQGTMQVRKSRARSATSPSIRWA